jgi:hypothetical protein
VNWHALRLELDKPMADTPTGTDSCLQNAHAQNEAKSTQHNNRQQSQHVATPYGAGILLGWRQSDGMCRVKLGGWGAEAVLFPGCVKFIVHGAK